MFFGTHERISSESSGQLFLCILNIALRWHIIAVYVYYGWESMHINLSVLVIVYQWELVSRFGMSWYKKIKHLICDYLILFQPVMLNLSTLSHKLCTVCRSIFVSHYSVSEFWKSYMLCCRSWTVKIWNLNLSPTVHVSYTFNSRPTNPSMWCQIIWCSTVHASDIR